MLPVGSCHPRLARIRPVIKSTTTTPIVLLSLMCSLVAASASAEPVPQPLDIDWGPAPAPEKGPPLSRHASRDRGLLGAQIGAIVGSWILFIVILGAYLALVGRRLRTEALAGRLSADVEMMMPAPMTSALNSASPSKAGRPNFPWPSPTSPVASFDERVIQDDKVKREMEMEKLYAAVMEHDASASRGGTTTTTSSARTSKHERPSPKKDGGNGRGSSPLSKLKSPIFLRSLTGSTTQRPSGSQDEKVVSTVTMDDRPRVSRDRRPTITMPSMPPSPSVSSPGRTGKSRVGIRHLPISKPMPTPSFNLHPQAPASDEEPLTPRYPPPSPPGSTHSRTSPSRYHMGHPSVSTVNSIHHHQQYIHPGEEQPSAAPAPVPAIQLSKPRPRRGGTPSNQSSDEIVSASPPPPPPSRPHPPSLTIPLGRPSQQTLRAAYTPSPSSATSSSLPLRSLNTALGSHPSAHTTKVTIVDRPDHFLSTTHHGPRTAGPSVPYSPYMPFTPVTPITPGLVSKRERKAREKEKCGGHSRGLKVVTEMVQGDDEIWKSGY